MFKVSILLSIKAYLFQKAQILLCQIHNFLNHPKSVPAQTYQDVSNMLGCDDRRADSLVLLCPIISCLQGKA